MDIVKIGKYLAELRNDHGLTQEKLGEKIGVTNKTISRWETGKYMPPVDILLTLSELYGVSINELLCGKKLTEQEYREAAESNLKDTLRMSAFSLSDRIAFFKQKWKKEHAFFMILEVLALIVVMIVGLVLDNGLQFVAVLLAFIWSIVTYNRMMQYVESHAFR